MKTRYTAKALLIYILPGIILSGCTVPGNSHSPSKGEIIISDELKEDNTSSDTTPEPKDINIVKLPEENGSIKENTNFAEIYSEITGFQKLKKNPKQGGMAEDPRIWGHLGC